MSLENPRKKILVIDDEEEICDLMKGWLTHLDYEVITSTDGDDGLWRAKTEKPDLIITDALMPGKTGYELVDALHGLSERMRTIPILMMSGRQSMRDTSGKVAAFIDKPFDPRTMLQTIQKLLSKDSY
ncbi:MAG: response regulator [Candidatus Omnitrophica bacterium]|nr:response regulator [Candidatus Omnitrophota bacterium]